MKIKIVYGDDMRRWRFPESNRFWSLKQFVKDTFKFGDDSSFCVQFEDDEHDRVTITSEKDFDDAFSCAEAEKRKSLKIFVVQGFIDQSQLKNKGIQSEEPKKENEEKPERNCAYWRQSALKFLQNEEIVALLPELTRRVVVGLKNEINGASSKKAKSEEKCMDGNEDVDEDETEKAASSGKDFGTILVEILSEDQFKVIANHELVEEKLAFVLPFVSKKIEMYQHILVGFNENAIAGWVPHLVQILIRGLTNFENITFDIDMDGNDFGDLTQVMPEWCAFVNNERVGGCSRSQKANSEVQHKNVACDECGAHPIIGARFKCAICVNYDLCSKCEAAKKHDNGHPLIKFTTPLSETKDLQFGGMHETIGRLGGPRNIFAQFPHHHRGPHHHRHHRHHHGFGHGPHGPHGPHGYRFGPPQAPPPPPHPFGFNYGYGYPYNGEMNQASFYGDSGNFGYGYEGQGSYGYEGHGYPQAYGNGYPHYNPHGFGYGGRGRGRGHGRGRGRFGRMHPRCPYMAGKCGKNQGKKQEKYGNLSNDINLLNACNKSFGPWIHDKKARKEMKKEWKQSKKDWKQAKKEFRQEKKFNKFEKKYGNHAKQSDILCVCGEKLDQVLSRFAYPQSVPCVICDVCNARCDRGSLIYHCPKRNALAHPNGYDICGQCAAVQATSFVNGSQNMKQENDRMYFEPPRGQNGQALGKVVEEPKILNENEIAEISIVKSVNKSNDSMEIENEIDINDIYDDVDVIAQEVKDEIKKEDTKSVLDEIFSGHNDDNEDDNDNNDDDEDSGEIVLLDDESVSENESEKSKEKGKDKLVVPPCEPEPEAEAEAEAQVEKDDDFVYSDHLNQVIGMGFDDNEHVRGLLLQHKGNVQRVIESLLQ